MKRGDTSDLVTKVLCSCLVFLSGVTSWVLVELYSRLQKDTQQVASDFAEYRKENKDIRERLAALESKVWPNK